MKKVLSLLLTIAFLSVMLVACKGNPAVGTYTLKTIKGMTPFDWIKDSMDATDEGVESLLELFDVKKNDLNEKFFILTLKEDGKASVYSEYSVLYKGTAEFEGEWSLDGDKLTVTVDGDAEIMTFKNGTLTCDFDGDEGVFEKG